MKGYNVVKLQVGHQSKVENEAYICSVEKRLHRAAHVVFYEEQMD